MPDQDTRLLRIIRLLYHQTAEDVDRIYTQLVEARKRAWIRAISDQAREFGYTGPVNAPRFQDLEWIRSESRQDAQSIVNTWNRDVDRQVDRLYTANPRGNRRYYAARMEQWAKARDVSKTRQISTQTEYSTVGYAQRRFREENGLRGASYYMDGPPPVCPICVGHFAKGIVSQAYVDKNPTPIHIACPHFWRLLRSSVRRIPPSELWVG